MFATVTFISCLISIENEITLSPRFQMVKGFLPMYLVGEQLNSGEQSDGLQLSKMPEIPEDLLKTLEPDHIMSTYGKGAPQIPCCLAMCGSGCALQTVSNNVSFYFILFYLVLFQRI